MEKVFCTIITRSHWAWALALLDSLRQFDPELPFAVLITDIDRLEPQELRGVENVEVLFLKEVVQVDLGRRIAAKYAAQSDELRWSLKPVLMTHLLKRYGKVIYGDCDLHFFSDPAWLWKELDTAHVLLSPHWRSSVATKDRPNFDLLYVGGLYNGGFVGAARGGIAALTAWGENCAEVCIKDFSQGQYVDQTHLNLLPVYFDDVRVLKHRGCNVANWNMVECARTTTADGTVTINATYPIVFIHFTRSMIDGIVSGTDGLLMPHVNTLRDRLLARGHGQDIIAASKERLQRKNEHASSPTVQQRLQHVVKRITGSK